MNPNLVTQLANEHVFGWTITFYFFVASLAAGLFAFATIVELFGLAKLQRLGRIAALTAPFMAGVVAITLMAELAQPARFWRVLVRFNPTSPISWGTWILVLFGLLSALYAYAEWKGLLRLKRSISYVGVPLGSLLPLYTAFELLMTRSSPLWNNALMPVIYILSAAVSAGALVLIISALTRPFPLAEATFTLGRILSHLLVYVLALFVIELLVLLSRSPVSTHIGRNILGGEYSFLFWGLVVLFGTIAPIAILYSHHSGRIRLNQVIAGVLILVGTFSLRALEIFAGQNFPAH